MIQQYFLGCPIWANREWVGEFFSPDARPADFLRQYADVLNTVEGNNTFYGLPKKDTVKRWYAETPANFRFSFKFPKTISHKYKLGYTDKLLAEFLDTMSPLAEKLGILFLQLPPGFGSEGLPALARFLEQLPGEFEYSVEVRNEDFFRENGAGAALNELLANRNVNRAIFDTAVLHEMESDDPFVIAAQKRKPKMPTQFVATGNHPFVRFVGHNTVKPNLPFLQQLAVTVASWIEGGRAPFVFFHSPNDFYAPHLCRAFHQILKEKLTSVDVGNFPAFPAERRDGEQLSLF